MSISAYSVTMAVFWFTLAALIGSVTLRRITRGGFLFLSVIFILTLVRGLLPYEFSGSIIIRSKIWYPFLQSVIQWELIPSFTVGHALLWLWLGIAAVKMLAVCRRLRGLALFRKTALVEPPESTLTQLANEVAAEFGYSGSVIVRISDTLTTALQAGFRRPFVILPVNFEEFTIEELRFMFRHELSHFMGNDLWVKSIVELLMCILWWNPAAALLNSSIDQMLELRCDKRVCAKVSQEGQRAYQNTLMHLARVNTDNNHSIVASCLGSNEDEQIIQRFKLIVSAKAEPQSRGKVILGLVLSALLFVGSYTFTVQPWVSAPPMGNPNTTVVRNGSDTVSVNAVVVPDGTYIVYTSENEYQLYCNYTFICTLPEGSLAGEPICNYPIYEGGPHNEEVPQPDN